MATENPNLPAPEERVSDAAEDVQTVTSEVTSEVPETEASAAAEAEPVVETPAAEEPETEKSVAGTPAAEVPVAEAPAAEEPVAEPEAAPRAKRARIKPVAEAVETESVEEAVPAGAEVDFADEEAALAAQDAGLELEGETAEEAAADQLAQEAPSAEDKFAGKGKEELVALFMRMLEEQPVQSIRRDVEALKIAFYRIRRAEVEAARRKFVEEGGSEEDFAPAVDGAEVQLKELFKEYRHRRDEFIANLEAEKEKNLQVKLGIIEELKELVNSDETLNHTFNKFRELQQRWKETGIVPQQHVKDLWETYNLHVENFYSFIKINKALRDLVARIEGYVPERFEVSRSQRTEAAKAVPQRLKTALAIAKSNIEAFHRAQLPPQVDIEVMPGVRCVQRAVAIGRVGLYVPGGNAPLFSTVLMLALPARIAGCGEVILCTPAGRGGKIAPEVLFAADLCGVDRIFAVGGAQAVAAMAYGTESIPHVEKIFGPGNRYVTRAKQLVSTEAVAVDLPAGPSEVMVLADNSARAEFVAADLLSQAEHGDDSQAILVCRTERFARQVTRAVEEQIRYLSRGEAIRNSLANSRIVLFDEEYKQIAFANAYAPEHLIVSMRDAWGIAAKITAAGSVFIGNYSPESAGDYASGTNHTLPTGGWARACSGVNVDSFMRKITFQELTRDGLDALAPAITAMAEAEGLDAHANAVRVRMKGGIL